MPRIPTNRNQQTLIKKWKKGDRSALGEMYTHYNARLFSSVRGRLRAKYSIFCDETAKDLCQDTWITADRRIHTFDKRREFFPWLRGIGWNVVRNWVKKKGNQASMKKGELQNPFESDDPSRLWDEAGVLHPYSTEGPYQSTETKDKRRILMELIDNLHEPYRSVLSLTMQEYTLSEIAEELDVSPKTCSKQLQRGRDLLKEKLLRNRELHDELHDELRGKR
jgi:RNA polymerase sigma-70 factor, ECF subfamily